VRARRAGLAVTVSVLALLAVSCFEGPVDEELEIRFPARGGLVASSSVRLMKPDHASAAVEERLARARRELEEGKDAWSRELAALNPLAERLIVDRKNGEIVAATHRVYVKDPSELRVLFARAAGSVRLTSGPGWSEMALAPLRGSRAGEAERRRSAELVEIWSGRISRYFESLRSLYRYLDAEPGRAEICLEPLLAADKGPAAGGKAARPSPNEEENALIEPVQDAMNALIEMFEADPSSAYTPDEIVRRTNDPFPTRLTVVVAGRVLESEGFIVEKDGGEGGGTRLAVAEGGLFGAIATLEGTWIAPDPLVASVRFARSNGSETLDVAAFAAQPRIAKSGASPSAVRSEMEKALTPAPSYRVKWTVTRADAPAVSEEGTTEGATAPDRAPGEGPDEIDWDALDSPRAR